jgi:hypothetical protein
MSRDRFHTPKCLFISSSTLVQSSFLIILSELAVKGMLEKMGVCLKLKEKEVGIRSLRRGGA